jgi:hypothetical protein
MADFFSKLAGQVLGAAPEFWPLLPPRFAPWSGLARAAPDRSAQADLFLSPLIDPGNPHATVPLSNFHYAARPGPAPGPPLQPGQKPLMQEAPETPGFEGGVIHRQAIERERSSGAVPGVSRPGPSQPASPPRPVPPGALPDADSGGAAITSPDDAGESADHPLPGQSTIERGQPLPPQPALAPVLTLKPAPQPTAGQELPTPSVTPGLPTDLQRDTQAGPSAVQPGPIEGYEEAAHPPSAPAARQSSPVEGYIELVDRPGLVETGIKPLARYVELAGYAEASGPPLPPIPLPPAPVAGRSELDEARFPPEARQTEPVQARPASSARRTEPLGHYPEPILPGAEHGEASSTAGARPAPIEGRPGFVKAHLETVKDHFEPAEPQLQPVARPSEPAAGRAELVEIQPELVKPQPMPVARPPEILKGQSESVETRPMPAAQLPQSEDRAEPLAEPFEAPFRPGARSSWPVEVQRAGIPVQAPSRTPAPGIVSADAPSPTPSLVPALLTIQPAAPKPALLVQRQAVMGESSVALPAPQSLPTNGPDLLASPRTGTHLTTAATAGKTDFLEPTLPASLTVPLRSEPELMPAPDALHVPRLGQARSMAKDEDEQIVQPSLPPLLERLAFKEPEPIPTVRVTIGRVVVRASPPCGPAPSGPVELPRPDLSLEEYLQGSQGGEG